jgi:hypothetical protein
MKILLQDFNVKVGRKDIFKPTIGHESLHVISNDNGVGVVIFATSENLTVKSTIFPHHNINKFTWTSLDGKTHNQIDYIFIDRKRHSSILDVRSFRAADCDLLVVLYGYKTWSLTLREEHKLRVFQNRVLRRISGPKGDKVAGGWRKLHNEQLHDLYASPSIIRMIKSRRVRWTGYVARMGGKRNAYRILVGKSEGKRPL